MQTYDEFEGFIDEHAGDASFSSLGFMETDHIFKFPSKSRNQWRSQSYF